MQKFFEDFYSSELVRKQPSGFYTIGDEKLDHSFGLDQYVASFTPSKAQIENFAAISYLYGLIGYKVSNFTAIPAGYLATYKKDGKVATILVSEATITQYSYNLAEEILNFIKENELSEDERAFFLNARKFLYGEKKVSQGEKNTLLHICAKLNENIESSASLERVKDARDDAVELFVFSGEDSVNKRNCDENQLVIERVCRDILGYPLNESDASKEQVEESKIMGDKFLHETILPRYQTYMGNCGEKRDAQILNREELLRDFNSILKSPRRLAIILNICATDYSADLIADLLLEISKCESFDEQKQSIDEFVPQTPENYESKAEANKVLNLLGARTLDELGK